MAAFQMKIIRGLFAAGEYVAPRLAGRVGFALFCRTSNPNSLSAGENRANQRAAKLMAEARRHRLTTQSGWVAAYDFRPEVYTPRAPTVLIVHGWRSRTEHMIGIIRAARDLGFRVISLDLPGHGQSSGRTINMANAVEAVKAAETWFGPFEAMIGHSFGGAVVCNAAFGSVQQFSPVSTRRLVMISAPNRLIKIFRWFGATVGLGRKSQAAMEDRVFQLSGNPIEAFSGKDQLEVMKIPTILVHAPDDKQVEYSGAVEMATAGNHVQLLSADGLGHSRIISDVKILSEIAAFLNEERARMAA